MTKGLGAVGFTPFLLLLSSGFFGAFTLVTFGYFGFLVFIDLGALTLGSLFPSALVSFSAPAFVLLSTITIVLLLSPPPLIIHTSPPRQEEFIVSLLLLPLQSHDLEFIFPLPSSEGFSILQKSSPDRGSSGLRQKSASFSGSQYRDDSKGLG